MNLTLTLSVAVWKVDGSIPGNSLIATGSSNSMKGTITKTENGTSRNMSDTVRTNCGNKMSDSKIFFNKKLLLVCVLSLSKTFHSALA
jgi:hypothetical protein